MKEQPIIFSGPMVRAILDGRKTQMRRVVDLKKYPTAESAIEHGPYQVGQRLWVRETWAPTLNDRIVALRADGDDPGPDGKWRPSIHMPRWASRITLEVTDVTVERIQGIDSFGVYAEEVLHNPRWLLDALQAAEQHDYKLAREAGFTDDEIEDGESSWVYAIDAFRRLWDSINKKRGYGRESDPWARVVTFRKVET